MSSKVEEARRNFTSHKEKYEKLRADVAIKMRFLDENKVSAIYDYFERWALNTLSNLLYFL